MNDIVEQLLYDGYNISIKDGLYHINGIPFKELPNGELKRPNSLTYCKDASTVRIVVAMCGGMI